MNEDHKTQMDIHRLENYDDEIELMDYLLVIWKWKYLIKNSGGSPRRYQTRPSG